MNQDFRPAATQWGRWLELTATWGKRAAAVLSKLRLVRPGRFIEFPIDLASILGAIAICCLLTGTFNSLGNADIRAAYARHIPTALQGATSPADAVNRLIDAGWADESLREWLASAVEADQTSAALILRLCQQVASQEKYPRRNAETLERLATGDPASIFPPPSIALRTISGAELVEELRRGDSYLHNSLVKDVAAEAKRDCLVRLCEDLLAATRSGIRNVRRWNGSCQWLTIALTAFALIMLGRRAWLLHRLSRSGVRETAPHSSAEAATSAPAAASTPASRVAQPAWSDADLAAIPRLLAANSVAGASRAEQTMLLQEESNRLSATVEARVYDPLGFLTSCLPSLGFIGTVVGMGEALLLADSLFGATNRQRVISGMTEQLGYAFDTTLVALLCGLLVGAATALVRRYDHAFVAAFEATLVNRFLDDRSRPAGGESSRQ